jgi:two-component system chemotaxis sensor kinase CheA
LAQLAFHAGLSTARSVTDLSGRGMGLSVVQEAVRRLQGEVSLRRREGGGTAVHISVPLSISTHRLLLVSHGSQTFGIPIHAVERLHRIKRQSVETREGRPVVILNDQAAPLFTLSHLMGLEESSSFAKTDMLLLMVIGSKTRRIAVAVEAFLGESDSVVQDLGPAAPRDNKISGGILLEDGGMAFVLNPDALFETPIQPSLPFLSQPSEPAKRESAHSILVVDDSITTRTLEKSILEAHGYRVSIAIDGLDALARLRAEKPDLVVSDIQMPRMDGFELLEAMKGDPALSRIPVIVVTSLERREDQERGLALGADAYIVKRRFDQAELLATVRQIL